MTPHSNTTSATLQPQAETRERLATATVSIIVPCLNEVESLPQLREKIAELTENCESQYGFHLVFVDDGSSDATCEMIHELFDDGFDVDVLKHPVNRGIGAALATGLNACGTDIAVTIDADCTFDPLNIPQLLNELKGDVAVVVGSPYYAPGLVTNVPAWRICLSRVCSWVYGRLFRNSLTCYTGCFRAMRLDNMRHFELANSGFVGVVEILWNYDRAGMKIVEIPSRLTPRRFGASKMRTMRAIWRHVTFIASIASGSGKSKKQK